MDFRLDPGPVAADSILELERLARAAGKAIVGTIGEIETKPGIINVVPAEIRFSLDIRGVDEEAFRSVARDIAAYAEESARRRGMTADFSERQTLPATPLDGRIVSALEDAAKATGEAHMLMPSGAAHDTMCVAGHVPSAMVFVPCKDGMSHSPLEDASPADAALAAEIMLNAIAVLMGRAP
jgi:acetylornithine deacetylase/succinyl-diaminopimelate desuccinylase-like protein